MVRLSDLAPSVLGTEFDTLVPARRNEPAFVFPWSDAAGTGATGWVVYYNACNAVCGGGIFMHAQATLQETADIAYVAI